MIFGHAVIAWIFFLIFYYCKILNFGLSKVRFRRKKQKDLKDDGNLKHFFQFLLFQGWESKGLYPHDKWRDEMGYRMVFFSIGIMLVAILWVYRYAPDNM